VAAAQLVLTVPHQSLLSGILNTVHAQVLVAQHIGRTLRAHQCEHWAELLNMPTARSVETVLAAHRKQDVLEIQELPLQ
jgi:propanediol dehydratase small subunit